MILTITANPSVDISYTLDDLSIDSVNRTSIVKKDAGGKGVHVSYVLKLLGEKVRDTGFVGGKLGEYIEEVLNKKEIDTDFVKIKEETRNCIAIIHGENTTEILEKGPKISEEEKREFLDKLNEITNSCKMISISGSLPDGLDSSFYLEIIKYAKENGIFIAVDTSQKVLKDVIEADIKPDLIKPNIHELEEVTQKRYFSNVNMVVNSLKEEPFKDIDYIVASMGKDGGVFKIKDKYYLAKVPEVEAVNPVGSGDSTLAGALSAISNDEKDEDIIKKSMNCGLLNALDEEIGHIDLDKFDEYYEKILVKEIK
ncbi:MAG: hexose kinase [Tissierellia bacterium]|nr:hexose kinase [Tissierellia bacterium]